MLLPTRVNRVLSIDPVRDFDALFGRTINGHNAATTYAVDVREDADHLYVDAELPGFKKEEIDITLENQTLTISGQRQENTTEEKKGELLLNERRTSRFGRSFKLPLTISEQSVNAKLENGVLTITLDKREESKPRKIVVN